MNLFNKLFTRKETVAYSSASLAELLSRITGGATKSGASVSLDTAIQVSTVIACVRVIASGVAQVPLRLMIESNDGRTRLPAKEHDLYDILHKKPSRFQSSFELRETMLLSAILLGNAYCFINRIGLNGKIRELIFIPSTRIRVEQLDSGDLIYHVTGSNNQMRTIQASSMWHLKGLSLDGVIGVNTLNTAREAIGLAMASEETQANLHKDGVKSSGIYSVEGTLNADQYKALSEWVAKEFTGTRPVILDRNAKFHPLSMSSVDAQHLETRKLQVEEVCRHFGVMPIMVGQSDKAATYASAEQMFIAHLVHTLTPWYERFEQSIDCQLLTDAERKQGYYAFLDPAGMLRGALKDTAEYLYKLVSIGSMTRNESREKLDLNPINGLDEPLTPINLTGDANSNNAQGGQNG